eukprot:XP_028343328.1 nuclear pore-associated protein 1-like [Physeter catodon]
MSGKEQQREESSGIPSRSSSSLLPTSSRPCKRKIPLPLFLLLPWLRSPPSGKEALTWDRGELPPPPKLPRLAAAKNPGTLEKNTTADSLPPATHTWQVPATTTDLVDLYSTSPILSVPPPSPTPNIDQETRYAVPKCPPASPADSLPPSASDPIWGIPLKKNEGPFHSVRATTPLISDLPTPPSIPPFSFQPPSHEKEAPTPICVDSPPLLYIPTPLPVPTINPPILTGQPMTSMAIPSTSTVMASGSLTLKPTVHAEVYMDTTAPSQAVIFRSPPGFRVEQRHPAGVPGFIIPPVPMVPCATPIFNFPLAPKPTLSPYLGPLMGSRGPLSLVLLFSPAAHLRLQLLEAMNTTPSQSVIFQSVPFSRQHQQPFHRAVPSSGNTPPSGSNASVHACLDAFTCKAELGANDGQRPNEYFLLGNPAASAQDKILVAPAA